jgi:hypothetical protein
MAIIAIKGIKINELAIKLTDEENEITGNYSLISSVDKVLAKQSFNGYSDLKMPLSPDTHKALRAFIAHYKMDIQKTIGLDTE